MSGSSPLARGLRHGKRPRQRRLGIIPARAGFTSFLVMKGPVAPDHPRSRGVYHLIDEHLQACSVDHPRSRGVYLLQSSASLRGIGSSPLARGLPCREPTIRNIPGIIPARAGFTQQHHSQQAYRPDHPRSRGVYAGWLEEGLGGAGIIPARAGFTLTSELGQGTSTDHPRSRGVYRLLALVVVIGIGSSPLARGLP